MASVFVSRVVSVLYAYDTVPLSGFVADVSCPAPL